MSFRTAWAGFESGILHLLDLDNLTLLPVKQDSTGLAAAPDCRWEQSAINAIRVLFPVTALLSDARTASCDYSCCRQEIFPLAVVLSASVLDLTAHSFFSPAANPQVLHKQHSPPPLQAAARCRTVNVSGSLPFYSEVRPTPCRSSNSGFASHWCGKLQNSATRKPLASTICNA